MITLLWIIIIVCILLWLFGTFHGYSGRRWGYSEPAPLGLIVLVVLILLILLFHPFGIA